MFMLNCANLLDTCVVVTTGVSDRRGGTPASTSQTLVRVRALTVDPSVRCTQAVSVRRVRTGGTRRHHRVIAPSPGSIMAGVIADRKQELLSARLATPYQRSKCATWVRMTRFFRSLPGSPTVESCAADDVVSFLIAADATGKTVVHSMTCPREPA